MSDEASRTDDAEGAASGDEVSRDRAAEGASVVDEAPKDGAAAEGDAASEDDPEEPRERVDEDGLPLDREPTIDDVRSTEARHGRIAFGCTLTVVLLLVIFWLIRGGLIG